MRFGKHGYLPLDGDGSYDIKDRNRHIREPLVGVIFAILLAFSLVFNGFQARSLMAERSRPDHCRSNFSGLAYDTPVVYKSNPDTNSTQYEAYWDSLDSSPFAIVLGEQEAKKHGLGPSVPFPWDNEKQIYYIKAFHHIHCLKIIRNALKIYESGRKYNKANHEHLYHCIDALRQDIMCKPDDSIMSSRSETHVIGDGQVFQCRNWEQLVKWSQDPVRNACFKVLDDDRHVAHQLEVYSFCPQNSPYYATVQAYYEKHGHKPIYENSHEFEGNYERSRL